MCPPMPGPPTLSAVLPLIAWLLDPVDAPGLDDALRRVEAGYPKLRALRAEVDARRGKVREKRGAFDPVVTAGSEQYRYNKEGKAADFDATGAEVEWLLPNGVKLVTGSRLNFGAVKSPLSPTGRFGEAYAGFRIPLLRGLGTNPKLAELRQARLAVPSAEADLRAERLDALLNGGAAYLDLAGAQERRRLAEDLLEISRVRARQIVRRVELGELPPIDATEAETEVRRREGALAKAELDAAKAALKLGVYTGDDAAALGVVPATPPLPRVAPTVPRAVAAAEILRAGTQRPELVPFDLGRESLGIERDLARNERLPSLDFGVYPGSDNGPGGIGPTAKAGLYFNVPLGQNGARGREDAADAKLIKLAEDRALLVQNLRTEAAGAVAGLDAAAARVRAATAEVVLSDRLERLERRRFELGEGTLFLLNQRERAAFEARSRLVDVLVEYRQARLALRAAAARL